METDINNQLTIKVFRMNYEFLLKNYLNPEMWQKKWTLFEFKGYKITMNLYSINTKDEKINLEIDISHTIRVGKFICSTAKIVNFSLKIEDINFLKRKINTAIWEGIQYLEATYFIEAEDEYQELEQMRNKERRELSNIAARFLAKNNILNSNIIEAYTEAYIDACEKTYDLMQEYKNQRKFHPCADFYLVWLNSLENDPTREMRLDSVKENLENDELEKVQKEIAQYQQYMETEEFEEDMQSNLEEV